MITETGGEGKRLEKVSINKKSQFDGISLREARIPERIGLIVIALHKFGEANLQLNPGADDVINANDKIIVLGEQEQVDKLRSYCT